MEIVLDLHRVSRRFGPHVALDNLSVRLHAGDVYALLAPNGAGKTTTLNLILGFLQADAGSITVCGVDLAADPVAARQALAYLPEQVALYPELSGVANLRYFTLLAALRLDDTALRRLLTEAGLAASAHDRLAATYSKGMRQKVGIAIAFARNARLLLLDEPTSGLDPGASAELSCIIRTVAARGVAVLMATHDLYRIDEVATRVGLLHGGRIVREINPRSADPELLEQFFSTEAAL